MYALVLLLLLFAPASSHAGETDYLPGPLAPIYGLPGMDEFGVGNDMTLASLYEVRAFRGMPNWPRVYFSSGTNSTLPEGDDTNPGTRELPMKTATQLQTVMNRGEVIVVIDGDYIDAADELTGWDGWTFSATGCSEAFCAYLIPYNDEDVTDAENSISCLNVPGITGRVNDVALNITGEVAIGAIHIDKCPLLPDGGTPTTQGIVANTFQVSAPSQRSVFLGTKCSDAANSHVHCFRSASGGAVFLNTKASMRDAEDFSDGCATGNCHSSLCTAAATPFGCCAADLQCYNQTHVYETQSAGFTLITNETIELTSTNVSATAAGPVGIVSDCSTPISGCHEVIIGPTIVPPDTWTEASPGSAAASAGATGLINRTGATTDRYYGRMTILPFPDVLADGLERGFAPTDNQGDASSDTSNAYFFQNTVTGVQVPFLMRGMFNTASDQFTAIGKCNLVDESPLIDTDNNLVMEVGGGSVGPGSHRTTIDFDGTNAYDVDDGTTSFLCGVTEHANAASTDRFNCTGNGSPNEQEIYLNADFFGSADGGAEGPLEIGGAGVDQNAFSDGVTDLQPAAYCQRGECKAACTTTWNFPFHQDAVIPTEVIGGEVDLKSITLGTHFTGVGAK